MQPSLPNLDSLPQLRFLSIPSHGKWMMYISYRKQHLFIMVLTRCIVTHAAPVVHGLWFSHIRVLWIPFGVFLSSAAAAV